MPNEIDLVMALSAEELLGRPADVDLIIAYHRKNRAIVESGGKPKRGASGPALTLADIGIEKKPTVMKKRKL